MNKFDAIEELEALFGADSPSRNGHIELPDFGVFGPNVANLILSQSDFMSTPQLNQTPSMVEASPDLELIAPINTSRKGVQSTPNMTPNLAMTPTMASPHTLGAGLIDMTGQFGFIEQPGGTNLPSETSLSNFLQMFSTMDLPMMPPTVSPADLFTPTFTPGQPYTPGPLLDTPSVGGTSPLLETPGRPTVPLIASAGQAATSSAQRKRASPLNQTKAKRERSEEDEDSQSSKRRKHTGTRPGISSAQLLPPGAPPQLKTYLTESSTSRKDVPASYKVKAGEVPDDTIVNKIVAKRTANRDSARRSRQRKQQAMEFAQAQITHFKDRCQQLEEFIREHGLEPPVAATSPVFVPDDDVE